jgi:hypothetical protein
MSFERFARICRKIRLRGQTEVSANSRAGHKFNVDQVVDYVPKGASKFSVPCGAYKITKLLPERDGELQYRIQECS